VERVVSIFLEVVKEMILEIKPLQFIAKRGFLDFDMGIRQPKWRFYARFYAKRETDSIYREWSNVFVDVPSTL
jgi:hypothetical protein